MPVYIRKNVSFTPLSIGRMSDEEEDDYLQDPDQLRDVLPQPYRMINKVLEKLLDDVWNILEQKENKRLAEDRKIKPPKYDQPDKMQVKSLYIYVSFDSSYSLYTDYSAAAVFKFRS